MNAEKRKDLLVCIRGIPEWQTALCFEQMAALSQTGAALMNTASNFGQGLADGKLRPDKYNWTDPSTRRDWNTGKVQNAASALGEGLAALEILSMLSDCLPQDLAHSMRFAYDIRYNQLEALCIKHGYIKEDDQ